MVQRDWQSSAEGGSLKIKGLRGGTIAEITQFLVDLEKANNSFYDFENFLSIDGRLWSRYGPGRFEMFGLSFMTSQLAGSRESILPEQVMPGLRLELRHVVLRSPGFWEFAGALNPLQQIREFLNDRHERRKDREYRETAEKDRLKLDNELIQRQIWEKDLHLLRERMSFVREMGIDDIALKQLIWTKVGAPLAQLGIHQDSGLIEGPADENQK